MPIAVVRIRYSFIWPCNAVSIINNLLPLYDFWTTSLDTSLMTTVNSNVIFWPGIKPVTVTSGLVTLNSTLPDDRLTPGTDGFIVIL